MQESSFAVSDLTTLGPAHLRVTDMAKTARLWAEIGLAVVHHGEKRLDLGVAERPLLVLHESAQSPAPMKSIGLFHLALSLPSRLELARAAARLRDAGYPYVGQDHLVSESVYFADPDGNGIELYFSTPERAQVHIIDDRPHFLTPAGVSHSGVEPLDMRRLWSEVDEHGQESGALPLATEVGHVHMRSNAPEACMRFYTEIIGFKPHISSASFGMFDCGTRARPHMIAFNMWGGRHLPKTPSTHAGLACLTIELAGEDLDAIYGRLGEASVDRWDGNTLLFDDPDGNHIYIRAN